MVVSEGLSCLGFLTVLSRRHPIDMFHNACGVIRIRPPDRFRASLHVPVCRTRVMPSLQPLHRPKPDTGLICEALLCPATLLPQFDHSCLTHTYNPSADPARTPRQQPAKYPSHCRHPPAIAPPNLYRASASRDSGSLERLLMRSFGEAESWGRPAWHTSCALPAESPQAHQRFPTISSLGSSHLGSTFPSDCECVGPAVIQHHVDPHLAR